MSDKTEKGFTEKEFKELWHKNWDKILECKKVAREHKKDDEFLDSFVIALKSGELEGFLECCQLAEKGGAAGFFEFYKAGKKQGFSDTLGLFKMVGEKDKNGNLVLIDAAQKSVCAILKRLEKPEPAGDNVISQKEEAGKEGEKIHRVLSRVSGSVGNIHNIIDIKTLSK